MPDRASMPASPSATAPATRASQSSPAATVSSPPERSTPRVATCTTSPSKPSSAITTSLPPPRTSTGSPAASAVPTASTRSASVSTTTSRRAGPPSRRVVRCASGVAVSSVPLTSGKLDDGLGAAEDLLPGGGDSEVDPDPAVLELGGDRGRDIDHRAGVVVGHGHRPGESGPVFEDGTRVADPVGDRAGGQRHGEHAVGDHVGEPDGAGDALVPVDDVEVAGRSGVAHQVGAADGKALSRQLGADLDVVVGDLGRHRRHPSPSGPRTTSVDSAVTTCSPPVVLTSARVVIMSCPPAERMVLMDTTVVSRSPARTGRVATNRCSPCTTRE